MCIQNGPKLIYERRGQGRKHKELRPLSGICDLVNWLAELLVTVLGRPVAVLYVEWPSHHLSS